jgi:hypothetical protein
MKLNSQTVPKELQIQHVTKKINDGKINFKVMNGINNTHPDI